MRAYDERMSFAVVDSRILITGAAMGMGRLYAERAVAEGAAVVILVDYNEQTLTETADALRASAGTTQKIVPLVVNLADRTAIEKAMSTVVADFGGVDVLINNAGVVTGSYFWEHNNERDTEFTMKVNALAPMFLAHELLPSMIAADRPARIVNIASAAGMVSNPKMSVYASSKWALIGWSDSLRLELLQNGYGHVKVTTVCPSYIATGMFEGVKGPLMTPIMKPDYVVNKVWAAMRSGKSMLMLPWTVHLSKVLKGFLPQRAFDWIADNLFGVYNTMDKFTGRTK